MVPQRCPHGRQRLGHGHGYKHDLDTKLLTLLRPGSRAPDSISTISSLWGCAVSGLAAGAVSSRGSTTRLGKRPAPPPASPSHHPSSPPRGVFVRTTLITSPALKLSSELFFPSKS